MIHVFVLHNTKREPVENRLREYELDFRLRNIAREPFTFQEFKTLLSFTTNGFDDILSQNSNTMKQFQKQGIQLEALSIKEAYHVIKLNPRLLHLPIVTDFKTRTGAGAGGAKLFKPRHKKKEDLFNIIYGLNAKPSLTLKEAEEHVLPK